MNPLNVAVTDHWTALEPLLSSQAMSNSISLLALFVAGAAYLHNRDAARHAMEAIQRDRTEADRARWQEKVETAEAEVRAHALALYDMLASIPTYDQFFPTKNLTPLPADPQPALLAVKPFAVEAQRMVQDGLLVPRSYCSPWFIEECRSLRTVLARLGSSIALVNLHAMDEAEEDRDALARLIIRRVEMVRGYLHATATATRVMTDRYDQMHDRVDYSGLFIDARLSIRPS